MRAATKRRVILDYIFLFDNLVDGVCGCASLLPPFSIVCKHGFEINIEMFTFGKHVAHLYRVVDEHIIVIFIIPAAHCLPPATLPPKAIHI